MWWLSAVGTLLLVTSLKGLPLDVNPEAEVVPALLENTTLATELKPPPIDESIGTRHGVVYLINIYAVTNSSDIEDGEEKLTDDVIETMPGILEPLATVLLVVEADDEEDPVSLDDIAKDLQEEGFEVEKVMKDGETKVIKVDFGEDPEAKPGNDLAVPVVKNVETTTNKVRRKRAPCLKCKLGKLLGGGGGNYGGGYGGGGYPGGGYPGGGYTGGGGGCGGGCGGGGGGGHYPSGGGGNTVGVIPVVVVPVSGYPGGGRPHGGGGGYPQGGYPQGGGNYYPGGQHNHGGGGGGQCQVCQGQGGGGGQGGSWSQSSAQASAQSSSGTW
ncbi:heavy metal-associated isoprenylated plant protein 33-like isoform X2 [Venturia canescens]|uniref:heavy metal-associated isoprenylated plant protein 33-like isoform X2 n=1 Tax=Venturia canescens TaxID=32260 RepID=UPI001C9D5737|nr:heavy metal-associated isoprenylated plant protein 33-like isoform X2 [Venturia canescens]